ncbi:MAG TPA: hypothetical protein HPQ04_09925 [Rhodospirillaceae bacterium]|nr:hypothetical protein [Rhodospirillaceae bacterium]
MPPMVKGRARFIRPYSDEKVNNSYNLLFCDILEMVKTSENREGDWRPIVFGEPLNLPLVQSIAYDEAAESRVRFLAFGRLRRKRIPVLPKIILGVIIESPQDQGLNTLAAYADGRVRYFNMVNHAILLEGQPAPVAEVARQVIRAAQPLVDRLGPAAQPRKPPPAPGALRFTFLVSDGTYTGEGAYPAIMNDELARPIMQRAEELMAEVTKIAAAAGATTN